MSENSYEKSVEISQKINEEMKKYGINLGNHNSLFIPITLPPIEGYGANANITISIYMNIFCVSFNAHHTKVLEPFARSIFDISDIEEACRVAFEVYTKLQDRVNVLYNNF